MRFFIFCLGLAITGHVVFADCGDGKAPKHRLALSWNGLSTSVRYDAGVKVFHERLAAGMSRHFLAQGSDRSRGDAPGAPSWAPDPPESSVTVLTATKGGLEKAARAIASEVARLREDGSAPSDVELVMYVTNHGTKFLGGPKGSSYGIRTRPLDDSGNELAFDDANLREADLRAFGAALPKGIRVKTIFGQCFGSNTAQTFLDAVDSPEMCKCGVSKADLGFPAWGIETAGGGINQDWSRNWDHRVIQTLAAGGNLADARAIGLLGFDAGVSPMRVRDREGNSQESINLSLSSGQITLLKSLTRAFADELPGIKNWSQRDFLAQANRLWRRAGARPLSPDAQAELTRRQAERARWAARVGVTEEMLAEERARFRANQSDRPYVSADDWVADHTFGSDLTPEEVRALLRTRAARTLVLQEALEEAFFRKADPVELTRFLAQAACERDPLVASAAPSGTPSPHRAGRDNHGH